MRAARVQGDRRRRDKNDRDDEQSTGERLQGHRAESMIHVHKEQRLRITRTAGSGRLLVQESTRVYEYVYMVRP